MAAEQAPAGLALEPSERRAGLVLAVIAAVAFIAIGTSWAVLGVAFAVAMLTASLRSTRPVTALTALLVAFGPWSFFFVFGAVYIAFGFLLLMRARRASTKPEA